MDNNDFVAEFHKTVRSPQGIYYLTHAAAALVLALLMIYRSAPSGSDIFFITVVLAASAIAFIRFVSLHKHVVINGEGIFVDKAFYPWNEIEHIYLSETGRGSILPRFRHIEIYLRDRLVFLYPGVLTNGAGLEDMLSRFVAEKRIKTK